MSQKLSFSHAAINHLKSELTSTQTLLKSFDNVSKNFREMNSEKVNEVLDLRKKNSDLQMQINLLVSLNTKLSSDLTSMSNKYSFSKSENIKMSSKLSNIYSSLKKLAPLSSSISLTTSTIHALVEGLSCHGNHIFDVFGKASQLIFDIKDGLKKYANERPFQDDEHHKIQFNDFIKVEGYVKEAVKGLEALRKISQKIRSLEVAEIANF